MLTPETMADIVRMLEVGAYLTHAAAAVGIDRRTVYRWLEQGAADRAARRDTIEVQFADAVARSRAKGCVAMVEVINRAGDRDWRAAAWMLERTEPGLFGQRVEIDSSRAQGHGEAPPPATERDVAAAATAAALEQDAIDLLTDGELELLEKLREREVQVLTRARGRRGSLA